jgi:hypothetical protein
MIRHFGAVLALLLSLSGDPAYWSTELKWHYGE